jgi:hypothetical protein
MRCFLVLSITLASYATPIAQVFHPPPTSAETPGGHRTLPKREEPSSYPWADDDDPIIENKFEWLGWDVSNEEDKQDGKKIQKAFREWHDFAIAGGESARAYQAEGPKRDRFKRWFGEQ